MNAWQSKANIAQKVSKARKIKKMCGLTLILSIAYVSINISRFSCRGRGRRSSQKAKAKDRFGHYTD